LRRPEGLLGTAGSPGGQLSKDGRRVDIHANNSLRPSSSTIQKRFLSASIIRQNVVNSRWPMLASGVLVERQTLRAALARER
jgi:hypothetical protein